MNKELSTALNIFGMWLLCIAFIIILCAVSENGFHLDIRTFLKIAGGSAIVTFPIMILAYSANNAGETK